jgi:hypothetical protein
MQTIICGHVCVDWQARVFHQGFSFERENRVCFFVSDDWVDMYVSLINS